MKISISLKPCPRCKAEPSNDGCGPSVSFAAQTDNSTLKREGTIFYVRCLNCGYIGPLVLCPKGFSKIKIFTAWNEHVKPRSTISTADLVKELSGREEVNIDSVLKGWGYMIEKCPPEENDENEYDYSDFESDNPGMWHGLEDEGPCTILVIKHERTTNQ